MISLSFVLYQYLERTFHTVHVLMAPRIRRKKKTAQTIKYFSSIYFLDLRDYYWNHCL